MYHFLLYLMFGGFTPGSSGGGSVSPLTTKGDIHTYSTTDARLPTAADGLCLLTDASTATGNKWGACGGSGASNYVEVDVDFGSTGNTSKTTAVTAAWVGGSSNIGCMPTAYASTGRTEGAEDAVLEGLIAVPSGRSAGVGFNLTVTPRTGKAYNVFKFTCIGN